MSFGEFEYRGMTIEIDRFEYTDNNDDWVILASQYRKSVHPILRARVIHQYPSAQNHTNATKRVCTLALLSTEHTIYRNVDIAAVRSGLV